MEGCWTGAGRIVVEGSMPDPGPNWYEEMDVDAEMEVDEDEGVVNEEEESRGSRPNWSKRADMTDSGQDMMSKSTGWSPKSAQ